jgi:hypothetical protein
MESYMLDLHLHKMNVGGDSTFVSVPARFTFETIKRCARACVKARSVSMATCAST